MFTNLFEIFRFGHRDWHERHSFAKIQNNNVKPLSEAAFQSFEQKPIVSRIAWDCCIKLCVIHLCAIWSIFHLTSVSWKSLCLETLFLLLAGFSVTAGAHRLWTHKSYKAKTPFRVFLMLSNTIAAQNDIFEWCRDHRVHHKYSDTDADPHNINKGLFFSHVGWLLLRKNPAVYEYGSKLNCSDLLEDQVVQFNRRYYGLLVCLFCFIIPTAIPWMAWGDPVLSCLLICFLRLTLSLHFTWSVNSFAHYFGDKPFDAIMKPTETPWVSIFAVGEGWHNYHHTFPHDYSCSELGWYINPTTMLIDAMAYFGQVYDRRSISKVTIMKQKLKHGDGKRLPRRIRELTQAERCKVAEGLTMQRRCEG